MAALVEVISFLQAHWIQERSRYSYHLQTPSDPVKNKRTSSSTKTAFPRNIKNIKETINEIRENHHDSVTPPKEIAFHDQTFTYG